MPDAGQVIKLYRRRHTIEPREDRLLYRCVHDGLPVIRRRGGWRHDPDAVREIARAVPIGWPR
jgi:hypothetical protein